jgi:hypothetical protein
MNMEYGNTPSITHRVCIQSRDMGRVKVYLVLAMQDGRATGLWVTCDMVGSTLRGLLDQWAAAVREMLNKGTDASRLVELFAWHEFEPKGITDNPKLRFARSITDYAVRWAKGVVEGEKPATEATTGTTGTEDGKREDGRRGDGADALDERWH